MQGERKLRLVQVGVGGWGETWLDRVCRSSDWELAAIVDREADNLATARARHGIEPTRCFADITAAAAEVDADAALVVVPAAAHLAVGREALDAGWDLLIEKPLTDTMDNSKALVAHAEASGRKLMVSQNYRFRRGALRLAEIFDEGWLGPVHYGRVEVCKELHFVLPDEPQGFALYRFARDAAVHHLDQIRGCLGVEVERVHAATQNPDWSWFTHPPMICGTLALTGGGVVQFYGSWIDRGRQTSFDGDWHVECANGQIRWSENRIFVRPVEPWLTIQMDGFLERSDGWMEAELPEGESEDRTRVLEVFHECIIDGLEPPTSGRDNLRTAALSFAMEDSAESGEVRDLARYLN